MPTIVSKNLVIRQVIGEFVSHIPPLWQDAYAKKLFTWNTSLLYLFGILQQCRSVGSIAGYLASTPWMQKWTDLESIDPSALNRRLNDLPTDMLKQIFVELIAKYASDYGLPQPMKHLGALAAVDASSITLGKVRGEWAYQQRGQNAVKLHVRLDLTGESSGVPSRVVLSTATVADLDKEVTSVLLKERQVTYLLDRGYLDYRQYITWSQKNIRFVARIKANSKMKVIRKQAPLASNVEQDAVVEFAHPDTGACEQLRLIVYTYVDAKGKRHRVRVLTNRWDVSAEDVSQMYRYRWKVELFFKFMKQQLGLKKMYSAKPQAVWNQIYLHLIAYMLLEHCRQQVKPTYKRGEWIRLLRAYLEQPWATLLKHLQKPKQRTSRGRRKKGGRPRKHPKRLKPKRILYW
ncbi:IS4 family transposase [Paenibacillus oenotherae]|uniref:IS4 family transposase n=1 Tax=Paenibacillus oenotherae TaxID=1435645 RepID=A0ABS7DD80_9BACL|nr:IS4 family transposase [Paenibacillus oenotherae]MBW7477866.1 IS4 family transposase [Paenibacillus oenotherae]